MSTLWDTHEVTFWVVGGRTYPDESFARRMVRAWEAQA